MTVWKCTALALVVLVVSPAVAGSPVSPFRDSVELGSYSTDFASLHLAREVPGGVEIDVVEGKFLSTVYTHPEDKNPLEVFRSYEKELAAAGFEIVLALSPDNGEVQNLVRDVYGRTKSYLNDRPYVANGKQQPMAALDRLRMFAKYYLVAEKRQADATYHVAVVICRERGFYFVDVLEVAAMEQGTVTLSAELLETALETEGKVAVYDIFFDTGSSTLRSESDAALETIASYLKSHPDTRFYVVGHTDDTGTLAANLELSDRRATAVADALAGRFGIAKDRLSARGVGPLAPVATNRSDSGRQLNRRVELVAQIERP